MNRCGFRFAKTAPLLSLFYPQPHKLFGNAEKGGELVGRKLTVLKELLVLDEKADRKEVRLLLEAPHRKPRFRAQKVGVCVRVEQHVTYLVRQGQAHLGLGEVLVYMYKPLSADGVEVAVDAPQILKQHDNIKTLRQLERVGGAVFFSDFLDILFHFQLLSG